jgi:hypothetical protein
MSSQASPGAFVDAVEEMREPTILAKIAAHLAPA